MQQITGLLFIGSLLAGCANTLHCQKINWNGQSPEIAGHPESISGKFNDYTTVLKPGKDAPEYQAGAPSVVMRSGN